MKKYCRIFAVAAIALSALWSCRAERKSDDTLKMNISSEPDSFFPWKSSAADSEALWRNIFEGLMTFDADGAVVPCLAESVSQSDDGLAYTFTLRKNVQFHNNKAFTAADAIWSYRNMAGLDGLKPTSSKFGAVKSVSANGDYEFIVELKEPFPSFLIAATSVILPEGYNDHENAPVGTGPYKFVSYERNQRVVLSKNEGYWNKDSMPKIPNVEVYIITDESASIAALQSGQLDVATMISGANAKAMENNFTAYRYPQNMVQILGMNNTVKPLDDVRVRKAVAMAVNKKEVINGVFNGYATETHSNFSPVLKEFYNDALQNENPYNPSRAKELLKEAGYENGFAVKITVPSNYQMNVDTAQIAAANLQEIGIKATIDTVEWATWLDTVYTKFNYQMTVIGFSGKADPADVLRRYYSAYNRNLTVFRNDEFDRNFSSAVQERDKQKQIEYYKECQRILAEMSPAVFICDPNQIYLSHKKVKGIRFYPVLFHNFAEWYFEP